MRYWVFLIVCVSFFFACDKSTSSTTEDDELSSSSVAQASSESITQSSSQTSNPTSSSSAGQVQPSSSSEVISSEQSSETSSSNEASSSVAQSSSAMDFDWTERYELREGGAVVYDKETKLEWQRCSFGQIWTGSECLGRALVYGGQYGNEKHVLDELGFRFPTQPELASLVYCSSGQPVTLGMDQMNQTCINSQSPTIVQEVFPIEHSSQGLSYWTVDSTEWTILGSTNITPVAVRFADGEVRHLLIGAYIRMVRTEAEKTSPALDSKYELRENGSVVYDKDANLEWQRCAYGQVWNGELCEGTPIKLSWEDADTLDVDGFTLPTRTQLISLVYCSDTERYYTGKGGDCGSALKKGYIQPTIAPNYFPGTPVEGRFWVTGENYYVSFISGKPFRQMLASTTAYSRLVRTVAP